MAKSKKSTKQKVISDYNGYDYKKIFWEDADRAYEDAADRMAIRKLLPKHMDKFVDIAGGYGRLADEYLPRAKSATLFDYSKTELKQAREIYGKRLKTKAGDIYDLPFKDGEFSTLMMIRATHHFKDMKKVTAELYRILKPGGIAVIEVANKKTLPRMVRFITRRTKINPFDRSVANLTDISKNGFYNYHPKYMEDIFKKQGFKIEKVLSVSNFRNRTLKNILGTERLIKLENGAQKILAPIRFAPSIYYKLEKPGDK
ncbi:class I SAM-dependent methyltransferase [Candidatus Saccharibacteria bacterium]|nr:class I SAM-dependent methyltransferase [Candidatus Saccharibacteria bacterium]